MITKLDLMDQGTDAKVGQVGKDLTCLRLFSGNSRKSADALTKGLRRRG